jgi:hypothetical protein
MGTYYIVYNLTKKECFCGHDIGADIKFNTTFNEDIPKVLARLICYGGRWWTDVIGIVGDEQNQKYYEKILTICNTTPELKTTLKEIMEEIEESEK